MSQREFPDSIQQQIAELDQLWREWLFGDLTASEAISRVASKERAFFGLIEDAEQQRLEANLIIKAQIEPYLTAMLKSIAVIRKKGLNESNAIVRGAEFHKHLPPSSLVRDPVNGNLTVPFPGETTPHLEF